MYYKEHLQILTKIIPNSSKISNYELELFMINLIKTDPMLNLAYQNSLILQKKIDIRYFNNKLKQPTEINVIKSLYHDFELPLILGYKTQKKNTSKCFNIKQFIPYKLKNFYKSFY